MSDPGTPDERGPLRIGLTGGIASGKSTVARQFAARDVPVIDLDVISRQVVEPGTRGLAAIVEAFGGDVLDASGRLDRAEVRKRVFADPDLRRRLESILHPRILAETVRQCEAAGGPYQVVVIPLLVESGLTSWVDRVLVVDADPEVQVARLVARDGGDEAQARAILAAQASREDRLAAADDVIENSGSMDVLHEAVERLDTAYRVMARTGETRARGIRLP